MQSFKRSYIFEASLAGRTTFHKTKTGAFYQYVTLKPDLEFYEAEKEAKLLQMDGSPSDVSISKGTKFKMISREEKDLTTIGRSYFACIEYKNTKYLIALNKILKPTGKNVPDMVVDLSGKKDPNVFTPFKGGHGHEAQFTEAWITGTGDEWQFNYGRSTFKVVRLGAPDWRGQGNPKTDVSVELDKKFGRLGKVLKYSLKAANATYFENWMLPARFLQIFGARQAKTLLEGAIDELNKTGKIGGTTTKTHTICPFIKNGKHNSVKLTSKQMQEVISGEKKFTGAASEGAANVFFGGDVPKGDVSEILKKTKTVATQAKGIKAGLDFRGSSEMKNSSCFIKGDGGKWYVNPKGWGAMVGKGYTEV